MSLVPKQLFSVVVRANEVSNALLLATRQTLCSASSCSAVFLVGNFERLRVVGAVVSARGFIHQYARASCYILSRSPFCLSPFIDSWSLLLVCFFPSHFFLALSDLALMVQVTSSINNPVIPKFCVIAVLGLSLSMYSLLIHSTNLILFCGCLVQYPVVAEG